MQCVLLFLVLVGNSGLFDLTLTLTILMRSCAGGWSVQLTESINWTSFHQERATGLPISQLAYNNSSPVSSECQVQINN